MPMWMLYDDRLPGQFGEFLTIPSTVSAAILLLVLVAPLALISRWAASQAGWTRAAR